MSPFLPADCSARKGLDVKSKEQRARAPLSSTFRDACVTILDRRIKVVAWVAMLVYVVSSCASEPDRAKAWSPLTPADEIQIIIQICLPNKAVSFEDVEVELTGIPFAKTMREERAANGYRETGDSRATVPVTERQIDPERAIVRRWVPGSGADQLNRSFLGFGEILNRGGILSASGDHIFLWSNSEKSQPIYEKEGHRLNDTIALDVSAEVNGEFVTYWYKPPGKIPTGQFSNWHEPISQETKSDKEHSRNPTFWNLTHGRDIEIHPVTGNAPKIRYRLMTVEEYYDQYRFWKRAQKAVGEKFFRGVVSEDREKRHFVPKLLGSIPVC